MNKFLKKCQTAFKDKDLILFQGLYPCNPITNYFNDPIKRRKVLTPYVQIICDIILETGLPFVIEQKIIAPEHSHFYMDILVKTKYHLISFEIDGKHHYTKKAQRKRDLKKAKHILKYHNIFTIRIKNENIDEYINHKPKIVNEALEFLTKNLFKDKEEHIVIAEQKGRINKKIGLAKKGVLNLTEENYGFD